MDRLRSARSTLRRRVVAGLAMSALFPLFVGGAAAGVGQIEAAPDLRFVSPRSGDVVPAMLEIQLRATAVAEDIHILVTEATSPGMFRYVTRIAAPPRSRTETLARLIDTTALGDAGRFRLIAISTNQLIAAPGARIDARAIPSSAPLDSLEVRHAGAIVSPAGGARVDVVDTIRAQGFLPNSYIAVAVRPASEGAYWVQNNGMLVSPTIAMPIRVQFGGAGVYHLYLGVTYDRDLFDEGDRLTRLPEKDRDGHPVYWVGPVEVTHP